MKSYSLKLLTAFLVGIPVGCYTAFVAENFWNWFVVPILHLPEFGFLPWLGVWWLINILVRQTAENNDKRWSVMLTAIELCVPEEKQAALREAVDTSLGLTLLDGFSLVAGRMFANTAALAGGFLLHLFII